MASVTKTVFGFHQFRKLLCRPPLDKASGIEWAAVIKFVLFATQRPIKGSRGPIWFRINQTEIRDKAFIRRAPPYMEDPDWTLTVQLKDLIIACGLTTKSLIRDSKHNYTFSNTSSLILSLSVSAIQENQSRAVTF